MERFLQDINRKFSSHSESIKQLQSRQNKIGEITEMSRRAINNILIERDREKTIALFQAVYTSAFEKSTAHTNIVMIAGYAGLFTLWSQTSEYHSVKTSIIVGLLTLISLIVFIGWEVFKIIFHGVQLAKIARVIQAQDLPSDELFRRVENLSFGNNMTYLLNILWITVLIITISTGFSAALLLLFSFVHSIAF